MEENNYLIKRHKSLIEEDKRNSTSSAVSLVAGILCEDYERTAPHSYKESEQEFLNSKYLSDYFKLSIKKMITEEIQIEGEDLLKKLIEERNILWNNILNSGEPATKKEENKLSKLDKEIQRIKDEGITSVSKKCVTILGNFIKSDRTTKEMTEEEVKALFDAKQYKIRINSNIVDYFYKYMFKLDSPNISNYIKNNIEPYNIASHLLYTSGLYARPAYSSGVNYSYLSQEHLTLMFNKLYMVDKNYALEFVKMIKKLEVLDPNNFIRTFYALAKNNFKFAIEKGEEKNASLIGLYGKYRDALACVMDINNRYYKREDLDKLVSYSNNMKESFYNRIKPKLEKIDKEFAFELDNYIIESHKEFAYDDKKTNGKIAVDFASKIISIIFGHIIEFQNNQELVFLKSEYLSDYFKDSIREFLESEKQNKDIKEETIIILTNFLDSIRKISEMTKEEINALFTFNKYRNKTNENILDYLFIYILSLNYINSSTIIKDTISPIEIATQILEISKLKQNINSYIRTDQTKYFYFDYLEEIFIALYQFDENYALEFVELIKNISSLEVNEFIKEFYAFAENNFKHFKENNTSNDILRDPETSRIRNTFLYAMEFMLNKLNLTKTSAKGLKRTTCQ